MEAIDVLRKIHEFDGGMAALDSPTSAALQHVKQRVADGPDVRLEDCPCGRDGVYGPDEEQVELGGGQYICSGRHTYGDLVRDVLGP